MFHHRINYHSTHRATFHRINYHSTYSQGRSHHSNLIIWDYLKFSENKMFCRPFLHVAYKLIQATRKNCYCNAALKPLNQGLPALNIAKGCTVVWASILCQSRLCVGLHVHAAVAAWHRQADSTSSNSALGSLYRRAHNLRQARLCFSTT